MKKTFKLASIFTLLCLLLSATMVMEVSAETGYSTKDYVPETADFVNYWGGIGQIGPEDGGGVTTFAHVAMTVGLEGKAIELDTQFKLLSKKSAEEGGDGVDGWVTYSFSKTPGEDANDKSFPYFGGEKAGYFLHISNCSGTTAPNCAEIIVVKHDGTATSDVAKFFLDNALNVRLILKITENESGKFDLTFTRKEDGVLLKEQKDLELDKALFVNDNGQTFFSTAIYEGPGCDGNHWEHRGVSIFRCKAYTKNAENAVVTLDKTEYIFTEGGVYKPAVTVAVDEANLQEDVDYFLLYSDNRAVGTAKVSVLFINEYAGNPAITKEYTIKEEALPEPDSSGTSESSDISGSESDSEPESKETSESGGCDGAVTSTALLSVLALGALAILKKRSR